MATTNLSTIKPDQSQLVIELQTLLAAQSAWQDLYLSGTGETLIEMISAIGALNEYSIEQAYKQSFLDSAVTDSAVYAITRTLGVRLPRRNPALMTATFSRVDTSIALTIPAYSAFTCNSVPLYNRESFTFNVGEATTTVTLFQGEVRNFSLFAAGTDFQMFKSTENGFEVSDQDVRVLVNNNDIPVIYNGIWNSKGVDSIQDSTTKDGELLLTFGNDSYGFKPANNVQVDITYVLTKGAAGSDSSLSTQKIASLSDPIISGIVGAGGLTGGGDELSVETLRQISPLLFSSGGDKATTKSEFSAMAASYPGVMDALVVGQRELAPTDVRYMNLSRVSLLTTDPMTDAFWNAFVPWFQRRTMYPVRFYRQDPIPFPSVVSANVYCANSADLPSVRANIVAALTKLFSPRIGFIGFNIYRSDIYEAIQESDTRIVYLELLSPTQDIIVDIASPKALTIVSQDSTAGGTLPPGSGVLPVGSYTYGVSSVNATGESLVTNLITLTKTIVGANRLNWNRVIGATAYKVYGRDALNRGFIATVPATSAATYSYTDLGMVTPVGPLPPLDTSGVHYATMTNLFLNMYYTQRRV